MPDGPCHCGRRWQGRAPRCALQMLLQVTHGRVLSRRRCSSDQGCAVGAMIFNLERTVANQAENDTRPARGSVHLCAEH